MKSEFLRKYIYNCFLLIIPVLCWNLLLTNRLPEVFQPEIFGKDIPPYIAYTENILRTLLFGFTLLMPLSIFKRRQKNGLILYLTGIIFYFSSWLALIYFPQSSWSYSLLGFMAPAFTPLLWLTGIGLVGDSFYFGLPYKPWLFICVSFVFLLFHNIHAGIIYFRIYG